jgi:membrane-associated phospholipid phosphatase
MIFNQKTFIGYRPLFIIIIICFISISYTFLDIPLAVFFNNLSLPYLVDKSAYFFASWGLSSHYFIGFFIIAIVAFQFKHLSIARACVFLFIGVLVSGIACSILKIIFGRARPDEFYSLSMYGFYWFKFNAYYWSFPSGHSTTFWTVMLGLCVIKPRWSTFFIILGVFISLMRVFLAKHYLSDIIAGFYLALISVHEVRAFYQRKMYNLGSFGAR